MAKKNTVSVDAPDVAEIEYEKAQLVASARYARRRDLVSSLLEDGKKYTCTQVDSLISEFEHKNFTERKGN